MCKISIYIPQFLYLESEKHIEVDKVLKVVEVILGFRKKPIDINDEWEIK